MCWFIYQHSFFKDEVLTRRFLFFIIICKTLACFVYYWIYFCYYPKGFNGDSVSTLKDAEVMYGALQNHPTDFLKMLFGLHSESDLDPLYEPYFKHIDKWGRADVSSNFFLNDNRTPIRINAVIRCFSFGYYSVHALFMLFVSFIGQLAFYKAFKMYFKHKEIYFALIIFITPSILFWTSGVLKEPLAFALMGVFTYCFMKLFRDFQFKLSYVIGVLLTTLLFLILKPYILLLILLPFILFVSLSYFKTKSGLRIFIIYIAAYVVVGSSLFFVLKFVFHKDVIETIVVRQNDFINLSRGGTFLLNDQKYVRFEYGDTSQYYMSDTIQKMYKIKQHAQYMYWNPHALNDTIFEKDNIDTSSFQFISSCAPSGSAIFVPRITYSFYSFVRLIPIAFTNVLLRPFFIDAHSILELLASIENFMFVLIFLLAIYFRQNTNVDTNLVWMCLFIVLSSFILVGLTTTVLGAIVRYKIPFIPFLLMIPLLYLDINVIKSSIKKYKR
ncbi:MAG: hypothetical protein IT237_13070 [Bacteroidia bacterium]|nr:hypothetical protein [Bacteroidia bacterium]